MEAPAAPPSSRKRRWKKVLVIAGCSLAGLLLLVLLLAPPVVGSIVRAKIAAMILEETGATATVGDVSFSWSGRVRVSELRVVPQGFTGPLLDVKKVDVKVALFSAIGGSYLADVVVTAPTVTVERNAEGKFNYEFPEKPAAPASVGSGGGGGAPAARPLVRASLKVKDGSVLVRAKGAETAYRNLALDATVDTLEKPIAYGLSFDSPHGDRLQVEGSYDLATFSGSATVLLERLSLRNLTAAARAYSDVAELDGTVTGVLEYQLRGKLEFGGKASLQIDDATVVLPGRTLRLDRLSLTHEGAVDAKGDGAHVIGLAAGKAFGATLKVDVRDAFGARKAETSIQASTDLPALTALLRKLGSLPDGIALEGAVHLRGTVSSEGPAGDSRLPRAAWDLQATGTALAAVLDGKPMKLDRLSLRDAGALDPAGHLKSTIRIESGKAVQATLENELRDVLKDTRTVSSKLRADSDLGELGKVLEKLLGMKPGVVFEGKAGLTGSVESRNGLVRADLDLKAADLVAVEAGGERHDLDRELNARLVGTWDGKLRAGSAETLTLRSSFATLDAKGGVALGGKEAELRPSSLKLNADLALLGAKLSSFMADPPKLGGTAAVDASYADASLRATAVLKGLSAKGVFGPVDATLVHSGTVDPQGNGKHVVRLEAGKALDLSLTAVLRDVLLPTRAAEADLRLSSDLGALSAIVPLDLQGAVSVSGRVETKGADWAKFDLDGRAADLAKRTPLEKLATLKVAGLWDGKKSSLDLAQFKLESSALQADAKGGASLAEPFSIRDSSFQVRADLARLGPLLGLFLAEPPALAGTAVASGTCAGEAYTIDATLKGVTATVGKAAWGKSLPIAATIAQKGSFSLKKGGGLKIEAGTLVSEAATFAIEGEIRKVLEDAREGRIALRASILPGVLSRWSPDLGLDGDALALEATLDVSPKLTTAVVLTEVKRLLLRSTDAAGKAVVKTARTGPFELVLRKEGALLDAKATTERFEWSEPAYSAKGGLAAELRWDEAKGTWGTTKLSGLEFVDGKKNVVKDPGLTIRHDLGMKPGEILIRDASVASTFLNGTLKGTLRPGEKDLAFEGVEASFTYVPERLGAVLAPWLGGKLAGAEPRRLQFSVKGRAASTDLLDLLRGPSASMDLDLAKYTREGITASGRARLRLENGLLGSEAPLEINEGRATADLQADFRGRAAGPASRLAFAASDVKANAEMKVLGAINPIFHTYNGTVNGRIHADFRLGWAGEIDPAEPDWTRASARSLSGSGVFAVKELDVVGSPAVAQLMAALGEGNALRGELLGTDVRIAGGKVSYTDMTLKLARYQLRFSGEVTFADAARELKERPLRLRIEMPFTEHMAKKHAGLAKYTGKTFLVDMTGTVESPRLDVESILVEYAKRAAQAVIEDKAKELLEELLKKKKDKK
jgi:hypothetical protein